MVPFVTTSDGIPDALWLVRQPVIDLPDFDWSRGWKTGIGEIGDFFRFVRREFIEGEIIERVIDF